MIAVAQPHRFTRLRDHMDDFQQAFNDADRVLVLPVYAAGEAPVDGVDAQALAAGLNARGHRAAVALDGPDALVARLREDVASGQLGAGDLIVCMGAGDITKVAGGLAERLR